jgi:hypothetical protein
MFLSEYHKENGKVNSKPDQQNILRARCQAAKTALRHYMHVQEEDGVHAI